MHFNRHDYFKRIEERKIERKRVGEREREGESGREREQEVFQFFDIVEMLVCVPV